MYSKLVNLNLYKRAQVSIANRTYVDENFVDDFLSFYSSQAYWHSDISQAYGLFNDEFNTVIMLINKNLKAMDFDKQYLINKDSLKESAFSDYLKQNKKELNYLSIIEYDLRKIGECIFILLWKEALLTLTYDFHQTILQQSPGAEAKKLFYKLSKDWENLKIVINKVKHKQYELILERNYTLYKKDYDQEVKNLFDSLDTNFPENLRKHFIRLLKLNTWDILVQDFLTEQSQKKERQKEENKNKANPLNRRYGAPAYAYGG